MSTKTQTLAKSLHTVTALVNVGREALRYHVNGDVSSAIQNAARILGYADAADPYGLQDKARAILAAELEKADAKGGRA